MSLYSRAVLGVFSLAAGGMLLCATAFADEGDSYVGSLGQPKMDLIKVNVVNALQSGIPGMQADAAQLVRDLENIRPEQSYGECVIPLMAILKDESAATGTRVLAALALDELGSSMGHYAIERTGQFTDDAQLKYVCTWLTYERKTGKHFEDKGIAQWFEPIEEGAE